MTIRAKIVLVLMLFFLFFGALAGGIQRYIILPSYIAIEEEEALKNSRRVSQALDRERHHLDSLLHDWSAWDETYEFVDSGTPEYIENNLPPSTFTDNRLNLLYIVNRNGSVVYGKIYELDDMGEMRLKAFPEKVIDKDHPLLSYPIEGVPLLNAGISGIFITEKGPMILAVRPVINNENQGPVRGTMIMGRFLTSAMVDHLKRQTQVDFSILPLDAGETRTVMAQLTQKTATPMISTAAGGDYLNIFEPVQDVMGEPALVVKTEIPKQISERGRKTMRYSLALFALAGCCAIVVVLSFFQRVVFKPVKSLIRRTEGLAVADVSKDMGLPGGKDEIEILELTLANMFNRLEERSEALVAANRKLKQDMKRRQEEEAEKIRVQALVAEQKKYALVGQIAGKMAHDFNNVLGIIMGNVELMMMDCRDKKMCNALQLVIDQTIRGKNLTKNLVAFAKDQEPRHVFFDVNEKLELAVNLMKKDTDKVVFHLEHGRIPKLFADPGMIEHALVNLLQNAIHAVSKTPSAEVFWRSWVEGGSICFEIEDNGCGIPEAYLDRVFEPGFTLKGGRDLSGAYERGIKGTGYGLSNVEKYVTQHGGSVRVRSQVNAGAVVTICLPLVEKDLTTSEKEELVAERLYSGKSILLVEDEFPISDIQQRMLAHPPFGHQVDVAVDGAEAIRLLDHNTYDCVSLDYILPGTINGMDVYNHIRKRDEQLPVLFVSGNLEFLESVKELKLRDKMVDHVSKPCPNRVYVERINLLIGKTDSSPASR
ncbi:MAG TPA: hypothetical protein DHV36_01165 [Desulfobacteraceae bacterium]|nr:hypothetical protein [Desulfobacteraceae bacterium]